MASFCVICGEEFSRQDEDVVKVKEKGISTLRKFSELRKDGLQFYFQNEDEINLHVSCRKKYTKENSKGVYLPLPRRQVIPVLPDLPVDNSSKFDFENKCFLCENDVTDQNKVKVEKREIICTIGSDQTKETLVGALTKEPAEGNEAVLRRIENVDLKKENARYHKKCYLKTLLTRKGLKRGRPESTVISEAIDVIFSYMEESGEPQFSLQELKDLLDHQYVPDDRTILDRLEKKYEGRIRITRTSRETIITLIDSLSDILAQNWHSQKMTNLDDEKLRIVKKAAEIIRHDIQVKVYEKKLYPAPHSFLENASTDVPETLGLLLKTVAGKKAEQEEYKRKCLSIAHSLILLVRPKSFLSSILTALAVTIKKKFASKFLIDILNKLGFCASYTEANVCEVSAINFEDYESVQQPVESGFVQYVFDNADANIDTLDGHNTFHAMGGIECTSPVKKEVLSQPIPRINKVPSAQILGSFSHVPLQYYNKTMNGLQNIQIKDIQTENRIVPRPLNIMWLYGKVHDIPDIGGWNGFMQKINNDEPYDLTQIKPIPFINAPPSNFDTVNTALMVAAEKTRARGQTTTFVTFDQPLYAKAREIVATSGNVPLYKNIIIRIGGFHLLMSYMGSIGYTMAGSGLKELWSLIYAPNSVNHMLSGHAYARALRAHQLTYLALGQLILNHVTFTETQISDIETMLFNTIDNSTRKLLKSASFGEVTDKFEEAMSVIEEKSPTAKLWIQYFKMVCLIQNFVEAERSGNFVLHLETVKQMMPVFVATGHFNYGKSLITYLQDMSGLKDIIPADEYEKFTTGGLFTIRRTDKFWSGIWSDMVIEQSLMRTMKVAGGLTSGRSMTDSVLAKWILSMPVVQKVEECLEIFCGLDTNGENIHKDSTPSRLKRDEADVTKLLEWFHEHPPFREESGKIVSLSTGVAGDANCINCHKVFDIGREILSKKVGLKFTELTYARKEKVVPIAQLNSSIKCSEDNITLIDPLTIFQRISFLKKEDKEMKEYLRHELAPYPLALFDEYGIRKGKKSALYDLFEPIESVDLSGNVHYVVDGGHLLHRVVWRKGDTYNEICLSIINYLKKHYGQSISIVFDGYDEGTEQTCTKATERIRRSNRKTSAEVFFDGNMAITTSQEDFLSNNKNKTRFISLLQKHLQQHNISSKQSESDADKDIVSEAFTQAKTKETVVVIGEDIDLLVLMVALAQNETNLYFMKPGKGKQQTRIYNYASFRYPGLARNLLTLHAYGGCDTTSALYKIGKKKYFTIANRKPELTNLLETFTNDKATFEEITTAGEKFMAVIYGGEMTQCPDLIRYEKFTKNLTKNKLNLACLPPTKAATQQHALRVYHQVQLWSGNVLEPTKYGWTIQNDILHPVKTLLPPAPENVLKMIFCKCKTNCGSVCGCRKAGLVCSEICSNCKGQSCLNRQQNISMNEEDTEHETDIEDSSSNICDSNTRTKRRRTS